MMSLTVESVVRKVPSLERFAFRGTWMADVDVVWMLTEMYTSGLWRSLHDLTIVNYDAEL